MWALNTNANVGPETACFSLPQAPPGAGGRWQSPICCRRGIGGTVDPAARLQGYSEGNDIVLSAALGAEPEIGVLLAGHRLVEDSASFKGFERPVPFFRLLVTTARNQNLSPDQPRVRRDSRGRSSRREERRLAGPDQRRPTQKCGPGDPVPSGCDQQSPAARREEAA
jgi:hypothetical protein